MDGNQGQLIAGRHGLLDRNVISSVARAWLYHIYLSVKLVLKNLSFIGEFQSSFSKLTFVYGLSCDLNVLDIGSNHDAR